MKEITLNNINQVADKPTEFYGVAMIFGEGKGVNMLIYRDNKDGFLKTIDPKDFSKGYGSGSVFNHELKGFATSSMGRYIGEILKLDSRYHAFEFETSYELLKWIIQPLPMEKL